MALPLDEDLVLAGHALGRAQALEVAEHPLEAAHAAGVVGRDLSGERERVRLGPAGRDRAVEEAELPRPPAPRRRVR